jgi:O-antigen/teichoic acid export membrane protein
MDAAKPAVSAFRTESWLSRVMRSPVAQTFATTTLIVACGLIAGIQLARVLKPEGRGEVAAALLWPALLIYLGSLGLPQGLVVFTASEERDRHSKLLSTAACLGLALSALAILVGIPLLPFLLRSQSADVIHASRIFLATVPAGILSLLAVATLQGRSCFGKLNFVRTITPTGYVMGITALTLQHRLTVMNVIFVQLVLSYLTLAIAYFFLLQEGIHFSFARFEAALAKRLTVFGSKAYVGSLTGTANQRLDQALLAAWFPAAQLGLYSVAVSASGAADTIGFAFRTVASTHIARRSEPSEKIAELRRILARFWPILISGTIVLALLLPVLIPFFYGKAFHGSILPAEILLIGQVFYTSKNLLTSAAEAFGDSWLGSKAELIGFVPMFVLLVLLLPKFGIVGAAVASLVAYGIQFSVMLIGFSAKGLKGRKAATTAQL